MGILRSKIFIPQSTMSDIQGLLPLLASSGQPPVTFTQLVRFIAFTSRLRNEVLLVQPGSFQLVGHSQPILPPSIQEFISRTCFIPLPSVNIIWNFLAQTAWTIDLDIIPRGPDLPSIFAEHGHPRGISKIQLNLIMQC